MKTLIVLGVILCLTACAMSRKPEDEIKENLDEPWSSFSEHEHQAKKYKEPKKSYHHHHYKHKKILDDASKHQHQEKTEGKREKLVSKQGPHEIPSQEAELQADLHTSRKHLKDQHVVDAQQDLHLQDLAFEEVLRKEEAKSKSPHQYQRGQHKTDHFSETKIADEPSSPDHEKLFLDSNVKEKHDKPSHPVLEDSFETLQDKKMKKDKGHGKKYNKHKKTAEKSKDKKNKKSKNSKKENKKKKEKKYKKWN